MLHIKFHGHWRPEEDFRRDFTIYGRGGYLGHVTQTPWTNFQYPTTGRLNIKFSFNRCSGGHQKRRTEPVEGRQNLKDLEQKSKNDADFLQHNSSPVNLVRHMHKISNLRLKDPGMNFRSPGPGRFHMISGFNLPSGNLPSGVREEYVW